MTILKIVLSLQRPSTTIWQIVFHSLYGLPSTTIWQIVSLSLWRLLLLPPLR